MKRWRPFIALGLVLLALLSLSTGVATRLRALLIWPQKTPAEATLVARLELENTLLREVLQALTETDPPHSNALAARVLYRGVTAWNSALWINVGQKQGIQRDDPVVVGTALLGVIEEVLPSKSRVRLITDGDLHPSVRSTRDGHLLAKGELAGSSGPLWRTQSKLLSGTGFNYDHADAAGPARDLRSTPPLILPDDLLVTTGMDGIFPPGLEVARVLSVDPLQEGAISYSLKAKPVLENLDSLDIVFVLRKDVSKR